MNQVSHVASTTSAGHKRAWLPLAVICTFVYAAAVLIGSAKLITLGKISELFVFLTYASMFYAVCVHALRVFLIDRRNTLLGMGDPKKLVFILLISVITGCALEMLTLIGAPLSSPLVLSDWGVKRVAVFTVMAFTAYALILAQPSQCIFELARKKDTALSYGSRRMLRTCGLLMIISGILSALVAASFRLALFPCLLFGIALAIPLAFVISSQQIAKIPQWAFISIALPMGLLICTQVPAMTGISWDDQIHYKNALNLSYLTSPEITDEELWMSDMANLMSLGDDVGIDSVLWRTGDRSSFEDEIDGLQLNDIEMGNVQTQYHPDQLLSFASLGYVPSAAGLWLGRLLNLPLSTTIIMGRVLNLFSYCLICFWAIKISPVKKVLFTVVSLVPTNIFLASNYSYDPWLTSMILLGTALLLREMWGSKEPLDFSKIVTAMLVMFFGLGVKAVYFPVIGLFFLMPKSKFADASQRRRYYLFVVLFGLFVLASFVVPFLFGVGAGTEAGDMRGGSEVSSSGQLRFILNNPIEYAGILERFFVGTYFNPSYSSGYLFSFAYLSDSSPFLDFGINFSNPAVNLIPVIFLSVIALFDNEDGRAWTYAGKGSTLWVAVIYLVTYVLVATALYVSFTPVGHETVNGCQFRYQLPILAPMLALLLNYGKPLGFKDGTKKTVYIAVLLCLAFWVFAFVVTKNAI